MGALWENDAFKSMKEYIVKKKKSSLTFDREKYLLAEWLIELLQKNNNSEHLLDALQTLIASLSVYHILQTNCAFNKSEKINPKKPTDPVITTLTLPEDQLALAVTFFPTVGDAKQKLEEVCAKEAGNSNTLFVPHMSKMQESDLKKMIVTLCKKLIYPDRQHSLSQEKQSGSTPPPSPIIKPQNK